MKKKLLTTVLTVGVVLSLVGCGATESTSSESVEETTVAVTEETTEYGTEETTEYGTEEASTEVVEEAEVSLSETSNETFIRQSQKAFKEQQYVIISVKDSNYEDPNALDAIEEYHEVLLDNKNQVACTMGENGALTYYDFKTNTAYVLNDDATGFYKTKSEDTAAYYTDFCNSIYDFWLNVDDTFIEIEPSVNGDGLKTQQVLNDYVSSEDTNVSYCVSYFFENDSILPAYMTVYKQLINYTMEDGTTIEGAYWDVANSKYEFQFLSEDDPDFATFQMAIQLPADDECVVLEEGTANN